MKNLGHWVGLDEVESEGNPLLAPVPGRKRMMKQKRSRGWRGGLLVGFRVGWCRRGRCRSRSRWGGCFQLLCLNYGKVMKEKKREVNMRLFGVDWLPLHPDSNPQLHLYSHSCSWDVDYPTHPLLLVAMKREGVQGELSHQVNWIVDIGGRDGSRCVWRVHFRVLGW